MLPATWLRLTCRALSGRGQGTRGLFSNSAPSNWTKVVSDAEKIVGYPTSFMSLRCLLSDELSNVALHVRKLVGTQHPLLNTARGFVYDSRNNLQMRGLVVLLLSKAAGPSHTASELLAHDMVYGIYPRKGLEHKADNWLIRFSQRLKEGHKWLSVHPTLSGWIPPVAAWRAPSIWRGHHGIVDLKEWTVSDGPLKDMQLGNKMAVLSGDFLLANACSALAQLNNTKVVELISSAIGDLVQGIYYENLSNTEENRRTNGIDVASWEEQMFLSHGALLAKSCQAAMELAKHNKEMQMLAYKYGKHLSLSHKVSLSDLLTKHHLPQKLGFGGSLRNLGHLADIHSLFSLLNKAKTSRNQLDYSKLLAAVKSEKGVSSAVDLCCYHSNKALEAIQAFPSSEARSALENIASTITKF
uniref:all trans-polyprenyl-diphosphate synthase PDSS2 n=1 Tax=Monopterus albus TaxID=43700 RepID=UPI0009B4B2F8|nr:decaprenyl-diphosphate synthase subunit 2 [Monopterus albus]